MLDGIAGAAEFAFGSFGAFGERAVSARGEDAACRAHIDFRIGVGR
jgi:hypothetical protein